MYGSAIDPSGHDQLRGFITARQLQPVLLETKKILADFGISRNLGLAGAVRPKRRRHLSASLSQFDPKARDHSARQPLRVALGRVAGEFEDPVGDRFSHTVGILRAVQHG